MPRPAKSPRITTPKSKFNQLGFVFSNEIKEFDPCWGTSDLPKKSDVISVWISKFDEVRGENRQLSAIAKDKIISDIAKSLVFVWQSKSLEVLPVETIVDELSGLIVEGEALGTIHN